MPRHCSRLPPLEEQPPPGDCVQALSERYQDLLAIPATASAIRTFVTIDHHETDRRSSARS